MANNEKYIYLDNQSTTQVDERVLKKLLPFYINIFGNPSSNNFLGQQASLAISESRDHIADLIGSNPDGIYFTSGATEAINWVLCSLGESASGKNHIITSVIDHSAILKTCEYLEKFKGFEVTRLPVDDDGLISPEQVEAAIKSSTLLVATQHANNEIGCIQPIEEIGKVCRQHNVLFFVDAAQSLGKIPCDVMQMNIDFLAASGHKIYAPKGIGFLFMRENVKAFISPIFHGGGQEGGYRSGTENVAGIVGLGEACRLCKLYMATESSRVQAHRDKLLKLLTEGAPEVIINGGMTHRLPGNLNVSFPGISHNVLLRNLHGIYISKGSACNSNGKEYSYVLRAITNDNSRISSAIRIGIGRFNTDQEITMAASKILDIINNITLSQSQF